MRQKISPATMQKQTVTCDANECTMSPK